MEKNVTRMGSKLTVPSRTWQGKNVTSKIFDLKGHEGERARVHIGEDGKFTIETRARQGLLICELDVPEKIFLQVDSGDVDDLGNPIYESQEKALDITKVTLKEYETAEEVIEK